MMVQGVEDSGVLSKLFSGSWTSIVYQEAEEAYDDALPAVQDRDVTPSSIDSTDVAPAAAESTVIPVINTDAVEDGDADGDAHESRVTEFFHKSWSSLSEMFSNAGLSGNVEDESTSIQKDTAIPTSWTSSFLPNLDGTVPKDTLNEKEDHVEDSMNAEEGEHELLNALLPRGFRIGLVRLPDETNVPGARYLKLEGATTHEPGGPCLVFIHCLGLVPFAQVAHNVASSSVLENKFSGGIFLLEVLDTTKVERPDEALNVWGRCLAYWATKLSLGHITVIACGPARLLAYGLENSRENVRVRIVGLSTTVATPRQWTKWIQEASSMFADFTDDHHNPYLCRHPTRAWLENTSAKGLVRFVTRMPRVIRWNIFKRLGRRTGTGLSWTAYLEKEFQIEDILLPARCTGRNLFSYFFLDDLI
eukprot:GEMP01035207.1.p1 GENE.GEMP01035207.1~~GEMP01035207.1.p1  ORF type:complete len:419 (+),score=77.86 GEMP01035207.1:164-1420(+)